MLTNIACPILLLLGSITHSLTLKRYACLLILIVIYCTLITALTCQLQSLTTTNSYYSYYFQLRTPSPFIRVDIFVSPLFLSLSFSPCLSLSLFFSLSALFFSLSALFFSLSHFPFSLPSFHAHRQCVRKAVRPLFHPFLQPWLCVPPSVLLPLPQPISLPHSNTQQST